MKPILSSLRLDLKAQKEGSPWGLYDFDQASLVVVVVNDQNDGAVLYGVGGHIRMEMNEAGLSHLDDLGLHPPSAGVWVWEGKYLWHPGSYEYPLDGSSEPTGTWRQPTDNEWIAIREGRCPWNDEDWKLPKDRQPCPACGIFGCSDSCKGGW